jgi:hypothetical protein
MTFHANQNAAFANHTPMSAMVERPRRDFNKRDRAEGHGRPKDKRDDYKRRPRNFKGWDVAGEDE